MISLGCSMQNSPPPLPCRTRSTDRPRAFSAAIQSDRGDAPAQNDMAPTTRGSKRRKREAATKDWRWLLWDSDLAREKIHPELGAGWTAVLKEACCVRAGVHKDKVDRVREEGNSGPLRLWKRSTTFDQFKGIVMMVVTFTSVNFFCSLSSPPSPSLRPFGRALTQRIWSTARAGETICYVRDAPVAASCICHGCAHRARSGAAI